jgi:LuxR family transcriptional regulator, maltose regulon positive regulatory protein
MAWHEPGSRIRRMPVAAATAFAVTKIQPPRLRADLVARAVLEPALSQALQTQRLTLLVAAAGYGKTTTLTQLLSRLPRHCALAWISADHHDELQRLLECLTVALEPYDLPWRVAPEALATLACDNAGVREAATELVNALAGCEAPRGLIVIDDAHRLQDARSWQFLQSVVERLPTTWGVVIGSREEPPLSLARWRAAGDLAEFGQQDLQFSESEVEVLLAHDRRLPHAPSARELLKRTDGWPAGLRLSLSALQSGLKAGERGATSAWAGTPAKRHLFDYLAAEVLDGMPPPLRHFLLRCSLLPELTAQRCALLTSKPQAAAMLEEIERRGLFVSVLDAQEKTLRLHDLFRDFLEDRLQRDHADEVPGLLRRAAQAERDLPRRVGYLCRAAAWPEAAAALMAGGPSLLAAGGAANLEQMLGKFPAHAFEQQPELPLLRGLLAFTRYDWDSILPAMQQAARLFAQVQQTGLAAIARAYACAGLHHVGRSAQAEQELATLLVEPLDDMARAVTCYVAAWHEFSCERSDNIAPLITSMLDALDQLPDLAQWHQCANLSMLVGLPGMQAPLQRFADTVLRRSGDDPTQLRAGAMQVRAALALGRGRLDDAWTLLQAADADCRWLGSPRLLHMSGGFLLMLMHALRGDAQALQDLAQAALQDTRQACGPSHRRVHEVNVLMAAARAAWIVGLDRWQRQLNSDMQQAANPHDWAGAARCRRLSAAFVAIHEGQLAQAVALLTPLAEDAERHMFFAATQARLLLADVQLQRGQLDAAASQLQAALRALQASGDVGAAWLAGPLSLQRLARAPWQQRVDPGLLRLLQGPAQVPAASATAAAADATTTSNPGAAGPSLSPREREVLQHISAGHSNKLIARAFDLSPHTVKRHVANILNKLGLDSRGQAAAWLRENP